MSLTVMTSCLISLYFTLYLRYVNAQSGNKEFKGRAFIKNMSHVVQVDRVQFYPCCYFLLRDE